MTEEQIAKLVDTLPDEKVFELVELMQKQQDASERDPMLFYSPLPAQGKFHTMNKKERFFFGGNSSGKSYAGAYEICCYLRGEDPAGALGGRELPAPTRMKAFRKISTKCWLGSTSFAKGTELVHQNVLPLLPPGTFRWKEDKGLLEMHNGAILKVMTYEAGVRQWQSSEVDHIWLDEQAPYEIYIECRSRVGRRGGGIMNTLTPLGVHSVWMFYEVVENIHANPNIGYLFARMMDNYFLSEEQQQQLLCAYRGSDEEKTRLDGEFIQFEGLVHKNFNEHTHVVEPFPINDSFRSQGWRFGRVFDLHSRNDEICQWFMFRRDDPKLVFFDELSYPSGDIKTFCDVVIAKTEDYGIVNDLNIIDTHESADSMRVDPTMVSDMARKGIKGISAPSRSVDAGVTRLNDYLVADKIKIFNTCKNTIFSIKYFQWQNWKGIAKQENEPKEKFVKKDADEVRNLHYVCLYMPPVNIQRLISENKGNTQKIGAIYGRSARLAG